MITHNLVLRKDTSRWVKFQTPDIGQNKESLFNNNIIKHTAFYIQMYLTSFLKEKKSLFHSSDLPNLFQLTLMCVLDRRAEPYLQRQWL